MFATAKTTSFVTGVAVRATRSKPARRERCVRVFARDARATARADDQRLGRGRARTPRRSYLEGRDDARDALDAREEGRGAREGRETTRTRAFVDAGREATDDARKGGARDDARDARGRDRDG